MKLKEQAFANASAVLMAIVYVVCVLFVVLLPGVSKTVAVSWFHGFDLGLIWTGGPRGNFLVGLITATAGSWIAGWLFAWLYNKFAK